jgi:CheY-like chemotaxis protein
VFDLPEFIDDLERMVGPMAAAKQIGFRVELGAGMPGLVRADLKRLRQILINLLVNAVKFTLHGEVLLRIACRADVARFEVIDSGVGIAAEDLERIFLPFERSGVQNREPGTGLGLTITQLLTELMGGELSVRSQPGRGSHFGVRIYLPAQTADQGDTQVMTAITGYRGARCRVLVIDDEADHRQLIIGLLNPLGFRCAEAANAVDGLTLIDTEAPDVVLLDISMKGMDGWTCAQQIRAAGHRCPIIMVSANVFDNRQEQLLAAQCQGFVSKPVRESELLACLGGALEIDWLRADRPPRESGAPELPENTITASDRASLMALFRIGHVQGARRELQRIASGTPGAAAACEHLSVLIDRYELERCMDYLGVNTS